MVEVPTKHPGMRKAPDWVLFFAVPEEASFFNHPHRPRVRVIVAGMGRRNADEAISTVIAQGPPRRVITAGFAGGLNPTLQLGTLVFDTDDELDLAQPLLDAGAVPARFHCADRIAVTAAEKRKLYESTGADVVEMESQVIRSRCHNAGIPSATIRVISDAADRDLPIDFNKMMTASYRINWWRLFRSIAARPLLIHRLIEFQKETRVAAKELARVLSAVMEQDRPAN